LIFFLTLILIDQIAKAIVLTYFPQLIVFNQGISFGLYPSSDWFKINLALIGAMVFLLAGGKAKRLIISGGISNILDRLIRGGVVDFIDLGSLFRLANFNVAPPVFNLADVFICLGVGLLILNSLYKIISTSKED